MADFTGECNPGNPIGNTYCGYNGSVTDWDGPGIFYPKNGHTYEFIFTYAQTGSAGNDLWGMRIGEDFVHQGHNESHWSNGGIFYGNQPTVGVPINSTVYNSSGAMDEILWPVDLWAFHWGNGTIDCTVQITDLSEVGDPIPPTAAFHAVPTHTVPGATVSFFDDSDPGDDTITSWAWTFGDGGTSTAQNPTHAYAAVGVYTVSLTVTGSLGTDTETKVAYIVVGASFSLDVNRITPPGDTYEAIGTLTEANKKSIRPALNDAGSGIFSINKNSIEATADAIAPGNFVKVRFPEIDDDYIFAFFMEEGDFDLLSTDEEGGEDLTFGGPGLLSYLNRAVWRNYRFSVDWWPDDMDPPDEPDSRGSYAEGVLRVPAGKHRFYHVDPDPTHDQSVPLSNPYEYDTVAAFDAYFADLRMYRWYQPGGGTTHLDLVRFLDTGPHPDEYMAPFDPNDPMTVVLASWTRDTDQIRLSDVSDTPGGVLYRMIQEAQDPDRPAQPIPLVTIDFTETLDSNGDAWTTTDALAGLSASPGEDYLTTLNTLISTGVIDIYMDPNFGLHAYNSPSGRDLTGAFGVGNVRFEKGVNIAESLRREMLDRKAATHAEVQSNINGGYQRASAVITDASDFVTREIGVYADEEIEHLMVAVGDAALIATNGESDALQLEQVTDDDEANGLYFPGQDWTAHGKYWLGDTVTLHTGSGSLDYDEAPLRVAAITIFENDDTGQLRAQPELVSQVGQAERDLFGSETAGSRGTYAPRGATGAPASSSIVDAVAASTPPSAAVSIRYTFDTTTTNSDPGAGRLRLSNATQSSSVTIRADNADANGATVTALLDLLTSGRLRLVHATDPSKWITFSVSAVADASGYRNITVADVQHSATSPFANGDSIVLLADLGGGSGLTVEESDGSPTDSAITKIKFPNGSLAIASHEATFTEQEPSAVAHIADSSDAHDASAISVADAGSYFTGIDVEAALQELGAGGGGGGDTTVVVGGNVLLAELTAASSAQLDFTTRNVAGQAGAIFQSDYDEYEVEFLNIVPATNNVTLLMRAGTGGGPTYDSGANYDSIGFYAYTSSSGLAGSSGTGQSANNIIDSISNNTNYGLSGTLRLNDPGGAAYKTYEGLVTMQHQSVGVFNVRVGGVYKSATALTAIRFLFSSGNIASGTIRIRGIPKSGSGGAGTTVVVGGNVLLTELVASSSAQLDATTRNVTGQSGALIQSDYDEYLIEFIDLLPATNAVQLLMRMSVAGTFDTSSLYSTGGWTYISGGSATFGSTTTSITTTNIADISNTAGRGLSGHARLFNPAGSQTYKKMTYDIGWVEGTPVPKHATATALYNNTSAVDGVRFYMSSGNITSGIVRVYGVPKSGSGSSTVLGACLGATTYSSGSDTAIVSTSSTTPVDIDATNAKLDIVVPASGRVWVSISCWYAVAYSTFPGPNGYMDILTGSTVLGCIGMMGVAGNIASSPAVSGKLAYAFAGGVLLTGLTPGALTIKAAVRSGAVVSTTMTIYANDGAGGSGHIFPPFSMAAFAA